MKLFTRVLVFILHATCLCKNGNVYTKMELFRRKHIEDQQELRLGIMLQRRPADPLSLILNGRFDAKTENKQENEQKTQKTVEIMIHGICIHNDEENLKC